MICNLRPKHHRVSIIFKSDRDIEPTTREKNPIQEITGYAVNISKEKFLFNFAKMLFIIFICITLYVED